MSCFNNCYLPQPPRAWSRVQNSCSLITDTNNTVFNTLLGEKTAMLNKGNVLQYKALSSNLTKAQRYSKIAKGQWINRNTTWATQSARGYTNPNSTSLKRGGNVENIAIDPITGAIIGPTTAPPTCPKTVVPINEGLPSNGGGGSIEEPIIPPPVEPTPGSDTFPQIIPETPVEPIVIQDGGNLICSVRENICTGETYRSISQQLCNPTTDSDVPGTIQDLCWNDGTPTWYPKQRLTMSNSANKWPVNATLVGAIQIIPPVIISITSITNIVTIAWTQDQACLPITYYNIYQNDILIQTVPGTIFSSTIIVSSNNVNQYYIIAENTTAKIVSNKSNIATISIIDPPSNLYYTTIGSGKIQLSWVGQKYSKIKVSYNNYNNSKALICNNADLFFDIFGVPNCIGYDNYNNSRSLIGNNANLFFDISGLTNCLNYTFYISSIDSFNNESSKVVIHNIISRWSDPPSDLTEADIILTSITGVNEGTATIQLSWTEPNSCVSIDGYNIYIDDILEGTVIYTDTNTDTIYTTTPLIIDTTYIFTITTIFTQLEIQCESDPSIPLSVTLPPIYSQLNETTTESYMNYENSIILTYLDNGQFNFYYDLSMQFTLVGGGRANANVDVKTAAGGGGQILNSSESGWMVNSDNWDIIIGAGQKAPSSQDDLGGDSSITSSINNMSIAATDNVTYSGYGGGVGASGSKTRAAGGVYTQNIYAKTIGTRGSNYSMGIYGAGGGGAGGSLTTIDEAGSIQFILGNNGIDGSGDKGGKGGDGFQGIDGNFYGGGGGGGSDVSTIVGIGGTGGGGNGATIDTSSSDGKVNTGGGGGGGNNDNNPGNGGSGIVILKFKAP